MQQNQEERKVNLRESGFASRFHSERDGCRLVDGSYFIRSAAASSIGATSRCGSLTARELASVGTPGQNRQRPDIHEHEVCHPVTQYSREHTDSQTNPNTYGDRNPALHHHRPSHCSQPINTDQGQTYTSKNSKTFATTPTVNPTEPPTTIATLCRPTTPARRCFPAVIPALIEPASGIRLGPPVTVYPLSLSAYVRVWSVRPLTS